MNVINDRHQLRHQLSVIDELATKIKKKLERFNHNFAPLHNYSYYFDGCQMTRVGVWTWCRDCRVSFDVFLHLNDGSHAVYRRGNLFQPCPGKRQIRPESEPKGYIPFDIDSFNAGTE